MNQQRQRVRLWIIISGEKTMKERIGQLVLAASASYSGMYLIWQEEQPLDGKSRVSIDHTVGTRTCGDYEDS